MPTFTSEKLKKHYRLRHNVIVLLSFFLALAVLIPAAWYIHFQTTASMVYREAKNTRLALRYLTIEYAALDRPIADATQMDGFSSGTAQELCTLADAEGHLQLAAWDAKALRPLILTYSRDGVLVVYTYTPETDTEHWQVSGMVPMMAFSR